MDEGELLGLIARGDRAAFDELYRRTSPWLAVRLRRRCADGGVPDAAWTVEAHLEACAACREALAAPPDPAPPDGPPGTLLLFPASTTGFDAFETLTGWAHLAQAVWVVAIAAACLLLGVAGRLRVAAAVPLRLGLGLALAGTATYALLGPRP